MVGARDITLSLDDFVRLLVNYRLIARPTLGVIRAAFEALGAKGALVDRQTFVQLMERYGESISTGDLYAMIGQLTEKGYGGQSLPDHVGPEDFARKYMDFGPEAMEEGDFEGGDEVEGGEDGDGGYGEGGEYGENGENGQSGEGDAWDADLDQVE